MARAAGLGRVRAPRSKTSSRDLSPSHLDVSLSVASICMIANFMSFPFLFCTFTTGILTPKVPRDRFVYLKLKCGVCVVSTSTSHIDLDVFCLFGPLLSLLFLHISLTFLPSFPLSDIFSASFGYGWKKSNVESWTTLDGKGRIGSWVAWSTLRLVTFFSYP
jgi:hypothetical protein